jgi:AraC-like DNA-binding protein
VPHEYGADPLDPWEILWVHFDGQLAPTFMDLIRAHGGMRVPLGLDIEMRDRWTELAFAQSAIYPGYDIFVNTALYALLGSIVFRLQTRQHRAASAAPFDVHRLQAYIHRHLAETITLEDLARQLHLSPTHFVRVFKKHLGVSPIYYVIQRRIALACTLLAETRLTIKQISQKVGYEDPYYFSRLFKKVMRTNPTDYRRDTRTTK